MSSIPSLYENMQLVSLELSTAFSNCENRSILLKRLFSSEGVSQASDNERWAVRIDLSCNIRIKWSRDSTTKKIDGIFIDMESKDTFKLYGIGSFGAGYQQWKKIEYDGSRPWCTRVSFEFINKRALNYTAQNIVDECIKKSCKKSIEFRDSKCIRYYTEVLNAPLASHAQNISHSNDQKLQKEKGGIQEEIIFSTTSLPLPSLRKMIVSILPNFSKIFSEDSISDTLLKELFSKNGKIMFDKEDTFGPKSYNLRMGLIQKRSIKGFFIGICKHNLLETRHFFPTSNLFIKIEINHHGDKVSHIHNEKIDNQFLFNLTSFFRGEPSADPIQFDLKRVDALKESFPLPIATYEQLFPDLICDCPFLPNDQKFHINDPKLQNNKLETLKTFEIL